VAAAIGFGIATWVNPAGLDTSALRHGARDRPVLVVLGFRSELTATQARSLSFGPRLHYRPFSYRGLGPDGRPLPYGPEATYHSLEESAAMMDRQVRFFSREAGHKVAVVGESEGSLVVKYYLLTHPHAPVDEALLLSPILEPARVAYPAAGHGGFGVATRFALERVGELISAVMFHVDPDMPFLRSVEGNAALLRHGMGCAVPGVRQEAFLPLVAALAEPRPLHADIPVAVLPAMHGGIVTPGHVQSAVVVRLSGGRVPRFPRWEVTAEVVRGAAAAWQVPTLPIGLIPHREAGGDCG
jgi:pimeloyl-ACP methyl ester carboxylesterase